MADAVFLWEAAVGENGKKLDTVHFKQISQAPYVQVGAKAYRPKVEKRG